MKPINLTSVHDYLDILFEDKTPSEDDVIHAKKVYWRAYNTDLKSRRRKLFPVLQVRFSKQEHALIQSKLLQGQKVSSYIYQLVLNHLNKNINLEMPINTALIEQQLFLITEYLKELLDFQEIDSIILQELEQHIKTLEIVIQDAL